MSLFVLIALSLTFGFVHPNEARKARRNKANTHNKAMGQKKRPITLSMIDISAGNSNYTNFSKPEGSYGISYSIINADSMGFRLGLGTNTNKNNVGSKLQSTVADLDVLIGYNARTKLNGYLGLGFGYSSLTGSIIKAGMHYHALAGVSFKLSKQTNFFSEYKQYFLKVDNVNYDSSLLKFGVSFKFYPSNHREPKPRWSLYLNKKTKGW